jgi:hypothetical protein
MSSVMMRTTFGLAGSADWAAACTGEEKKNDIRARMPTYERM